MMRPPRAPPAGRGRSDDDLFERIVSLGLGMFALLAATLWLASQVAVRIQANRWAAFTLTAAGAVVVRLPGHVADPAKAWPAEMQSLLPGRLALLACLVGSGVGTVATSVVIVTCWRRLSERRPRGRGATWGRLGEFHGLTVRAPRPGRLILGRMGGRLVATEARHSVLAFGPTQSGKTTGLAVPAILEWDGPVVATSVKADLVRDTLCWRQGLGLTWIYDPTAVTGYPEATWSPLAQAYEWVGAQRLAHWLTTASAPRQGLTDADFWLSASAKLLAPLLHACARSGRTMSELVHWVDTMERGEVTASLVVAKADAALVAFEATWRRDDRQLSSIYTTTELVLAAFADPTVVASARSCQIDPTALLTGRHTLYLCGAAHEQSRLQGVFATLVQAVVDAAVQRAQSIGRPLDPPLLLVLDEAANIAPLRDLDTLASTAAGMGVQLMTICQDLAQLGSRYGPDRARTIANNHRAKIVLSGVSQKGQGR